MAIDASNTPQIDVTKVENPQEYYPNKLFQKEWVELTTYPAMQVHSLNEAINTETKRKVLSESAAL